MRTRRRSGAFYPAAALLLLGLLGAGASCTPPGESADAGSAPGPGADPARSSGAGARPQVRPGLDVLLSDSLHLVRGKRVGLVTNHTGVSGRFPAGAPDSVRSGVDILHEHPELDLVALFSPEHGLSGAAEAGERVASGQHASTGLPIYSLYTDTRRPLPHMLEGVDVLLFDIQDVGARYYTYVYTMAFSMQAAGEAGIPFVVLDRPNPVGGVLVQGNVLDTAFSSFVGLYPVPMRHGMTPGELARLYRGEFGIQAELHVVPLDGWSRTVWYDETGLEWIPPSPNMPSLESATHYPGTCLFEGTNLSVGRGSERPFQWVGAPWLDGALLAERLNAYGLPGVRFEVATFTPRSPGDAKWPDTEVYGVRFVVTDRSVYDPTEAAVAALVEARRAAGERWQWNAQHFDRLAGSDRLRLMIEEGRSAEEIVESWEAERAAFDRLREPYLIYR